MRQTCEVTSLRPDIDRGQVLIWHQNPSFRRKKEQRIKSNHAITISLVFDAVLQHVRCARRIWGAHRIASVSMGIVDEEDIK